MSDRQSSLSGSDISSFVFSSHTSRLTRNYTTFVHSYGTLWDPPGTSSPWCWFHSASLPLHMLLTGSGGQVKWWRHPASTPWFCILYTAHRWWHITDVCFRKQSQRGGFGRWHAIFHPFYFWSFFLASSIKWITSESVMTCVLLVLHHNLGMSVH